MPLQAIHTHQKYIHKISESHNPTLNNNKLKQNEQTTEVRIGINQKQGN